MIRIFGILPARVFTLFISEIVLLSACFVVVAFADPDIGDVGGFLIYDSGVARIALVVGFVVLSLFFRNLYAEIRLRSRLALLQDLLLIFGVAVLGQGVIGYLSPGWIIPRKVMLGGSVMAAVLIFGWRLLFDRASHSAVAAGRVLFLGTSPAVAKIASHLCEHPELGLTAMGYLESGSAAASWVKTGVKRLGTMEDLQTVLDQSLPDSIVIGNRDDIRPWWVDEFLSLRFGGIQVQEAGVLYERIFARKSVTEIWPSRAIFHSALEPGSIDAGFQSLYSWVLAMLAAVVTLPLTLAIAALIRLDSRGPVLTRETRVGRHDATFEAYGFRCVRSDGEVTAVGGFLRRRGLAWLPQLLNVLKGQIAMVGPRPERPVFARRMNELIPFYSQRHSIKPGITGWARIHRQSEGIQNSLSDLEYDLYYRENRTPLMDLFVLLLSLKKGRSYEDAMDSAA